MDGKSKYTKFIINKATGKPRTIHKVSKRLKKIQRIALKKLQAVKKFQPSSHSHGFTPGKSIVTNAIFHRRSKRIIKMDLKDFFPSIHFGRVRGMFMAYPFEFGEKAATTMAQLACLDDKSGILPQGGSLSPYIANMICRKMDKRLAEVARSHRCHFTRYADDITFSTNDVSKGNIEDLIKETSAVIEDENFIVNTDKTKILTPEERQVVTGIIVNDGINVNRRYVRNLRATLYNCEETSIESQKDKKVFQDNRSSRPNKGDFLRHLVGKISFYGSVVLSNNQDEKNSKNSTLFRRVQTYENILYRFYKLIKKPEEKVDSEFIDSVHTLLSKRPNLLEKLTLHNKIEGIKKSVLNEFRSKSQTKDKLKELDSKVSIPELDFFIEELRKGDPRIFSDYSRMPTLEDSKYKLKKLLQFPQISLIKTRTLLKSLKEGELKTLVHDDPILVKECYAILFDNYESEFYYLPRFLKEEFEAWKVHLDQVLNKEGESYRIDGLSIDPIMLDATTTLKKNTRFSGSPSASSNLEFEIQKLITELRLGVDRVEVRVDHRIAVYTHVPSILRAIKYALMSMDKTTDEKNIIIIDMVTGPRRVELRIFDDSKKTVPNKSLNNRIFVNGKLRKVIGLTNGLCEYWVEAELDNGERKIINMHSGISVKKTELSGLSNVFVHRFRFER